MTLHFCSNVTLEFVQKVLLVLVLALIYFLASAYTKVE